MAKYSNNPIPNLSTDWSRDPQSGLPFSGASVQSFIKQQFQGKVSAGWFDSTSMTLYLFKDEIDKAEFIEDTTKMGLVVGSVPLNFETTQYRIHVVPHDNNTTVNATINQESIDLVMDVQAEKRELGEPLWESMGHDVGVRVYIDAGNTGTYDEVTELAQTVNALYGQLSVNVMPYIPTGTSRVRFYFYSVNDNSISSSIMWTVTLAEMYIEEWNNTWYQAIVENGNESNYHLGGFKIVGTLAKTLNIQISTTSSVVASYSRDIGGLEAVESPYFFTRVEGFALDSPVSASGEELSPLTTGVYNVKVWLTSGNLSTEDMAITYSIMYVASGDEDSAQLVVMNNSGRQVNNYDEAAHLCDYAIYNANQSSGKPTVLITPYIAGTAGTSSTITSTVFTETRQSLNHSINLVTNSTQLTIRYRITMTGNYQEDVSSVDNTDIFPSEDGMTFYLNTSLRSNGEDTKTSIYNTASGNNVAVASTWTKMSWVDGIDGWTEDEDGRKCLMLPARTRLTIPPLSQNGYTFLSGENVTFELCYRVANVSNYSENIITIAQNPTDAGFMGIRIKPTNVTVHSGSNQSAANDIYQGTNLSDEETIHLVITIQRSYGGKDGYNLVTGYVNGCKNFQFSYTSGTIWANTYASAVFGSDTADLYLYMMRVYNGKALASSGVENNWLNSLVTRADKVAYKSFLQSVLKSSSRQIDYETIKNSGKYNFFVVEMTSGGVNVPSKSYPDGGRSNLEMHYGIDANGNSRSGWDWKIFDVETNGQGTTSMNYWLWNMRFRIDKTDDSGKRMISYYDTPVMHAGVRSFVMKTASSSKTVWFDGEGNHPAVKRITAKINFASSMQSHKMGATRAYTLLHDSIENGAMYNEAQTAAASAGNPMPVVAVYQYPAFGFQKTVDSLGNESYKFIGLFTIGPDKGDKPTFGWDLVKNDLVSLEGTDHTPQLAKFNVPWDQQTEYYVNSKGDGFLATKAPDDNYVGAFEVGNAKETDTKIAESAMPVLVDSFKNAYSVIYDNSTLIFPIALNDSTWGGADAATVLANINADIENFQKISYDGRLSYADMEFWIEGEYKLYHYEYETEQYVSGYKSNDSYGSPLDLRTDTGITDADLANKTLSEQNELFKAARRTRFIENAPTYWDMHELVFNYVFLVVFAATDNFAKNQYPYYMGGKWRFRQDDLDTLVDIDNNGGQTKPAYIEFSDSVGGSPYFAGSNSVLWNLVNECLWSDYTVNSVDYPGIRTMGRELIEKMSELAGGQDIYDGFNKFFDKYFWGEAQEYFPQSAYNIDAQIKYEDAWQTGISFSVLPLRQSLGNHYSAEKLWVRRRAVYCMSLFGVGAFGTYSDAYLGQIQFRPISLGSMSVTPAEDLYPCLIIGDDDVRPTGRAAGGTSHTFTSLVGDGNTVYTLQAVNYLTSLGDLKNLKLGNDDGGVFNLSGKKLVVFKMGDEDATVEVGGTDVDNVTTNVTTLNVATAGLPCLEEIDVRNAEDLSGSIDLTNCKRIKNVFTEGTKVSSVVLPRGSKVEKLHLSDYVTTISYQVVKYLSDLILPSSPSNITLIYLEECDALDCMTALENVYNTTGQQLQFIRLVWNTDRTVTGSQLRMLSNIMNNKDKSGGIHNYNGVDQTGSGAVTLNPYLEGVLVVDKYYPSDLIALRGSNTPSNSTEHSGMKQVRASYFGPLDIVYHEGNDYEYIEFADSVVEELCATNLGDGTGITMAQAAAITSIGTVFTDNDTITSFDELKYFTGLTSLPRNAFDDADSLVSISIPASITYFDQYSFRSNDSLATMTFYGHVTTAGNNFQNMSTLSRINIASISEWLTCSWYNGNGPQAAASSGGLHLYLIGSNTELTSVEIPLTINRIGDYAFSKCRGITAITIPSSVTSIGRNAFDSTAIRDLTIPDSVTSVGVNCFQYCASLQSVVLPPVPISLGGAFDGCTSLTTITMGAPMNASFNYTFRGTSNLKRINISSIADWIRCTWDRANYRYPSSASGEMHLFLNDVELTQVDVPSGLGITTIGESAFAKCVGITSFTFPSSITTFGGRAFLDCTGLTSFTIPSTVTTIGSDVWSGCTGLRGTFIMPSTVTSVGVAILEGCTGLTNVYWYRDYPERGLMWNNLHVGNGTGTFYVSGDYYQYGGEWSFDFKTIVINGDLIFSTGGSRHVTNSSYTKEFRIYGDVDYGTTTWNYITGSEARGIEFFEILGDIGDMSSANPFLYSCASNTIVHLGKNGVACPPNKITRSTNTNNIQTVYVGDGTNDDDVLAAYLADSDWSAYSSKLAKWSDYNGQYKNAPTIPSE